MPSRAVIIVVTGALLAARKCFGPTATLWCSVYRPFLRARRLRVCTLTISPRLTLRRGDPCTRARFKYLQLWLGVSNKLRFCGIREFP
jgi:hypothetical protein